MVGLSVDKVKADTNDIFVYSDSTMDEYSGQSTVCITKDATFKSIRTDQKFDRVKTITFAPDVVELPRYVFLQFPNVEVIELPTHLENLGGAFRLFYLNYDVNPIYALENLKSIVIHESNPYFSVEDNVLYTKDMTELLYYPSGKTDKIYEMPDFVTNIFSEAFQNNIYLEEIKIGSRYGMYYCTLAEDVGLPNLKRYSVAVDNYFFTQVDGVLFNYDQTELIAYPTGRKAVSYTVPSTVKDLYGYCMKGATIGTVILPSDINMTNFSSYFSPFVDSHIGAVEITDSEYYTSQDGVLYTKNLDAIAYWPSEKKVTNLTFPSTLKSLRLDKETIPCISEVTQITIPRDTSEINSIKDMDSLSEVSVEKGNQSFVMYSGCLYNKDCSELVILPPKLKNTSITIPGNYRKYHYATELREAEAITTVVVNGTGEEFPYQLLPNLAKIKLGKNNTKAKVVSDVLYSKTMSKLVWYPQNKKDTKFTIPSTVTSMSDKSFWQQRYLQSVTLPKNMKYNEYIQWFEDCKKLKEIKVAAGNKSLAASDGVLFTKDMKQLLYYPAGKTTKSYSIPDKTETFNIRTKNEYLTDLKLSKNLSRISDYSGKSFPNLKSITVASGNKYYSVVDGVLYYNYNDYRSLEIYPMGKTSKSFTILKNVDNIEWNIGFEYHPYLKVLTSQSPNYNVFGKTIYYLYNTY